MFGPSEDEIEKALEYENMLDQSYVDAPKEAIVLAREAYLKQKTEVDEMLTFQERKKTKDLGHRVLSDNSKLGTPVEQQPILMP